MIKKENFNIVYPRDNPHAKSKIYGDEFIEILEKVRKIIYYQNKFKISDGIKGFIFYGDVGIGKTTLAKTIASELNTPYIFVDGSDIARALYGESERQIAEIFKKSKDYTKTIIIIDDCESVFPKRDWIKGEAWHIAQNNVFFHCLDNVDTSSTTVILTTNRYDLLDKAVIDRLYSIEFPLPSKETLISIAKNKSNNLKIDFNNIEAIIDEKKFKTIRDLEKLLMEKYIDEVLSRKN